MDNNNSAKKELCTIKVVQNLFNPPISKSNASRKIQLVRDALDKPKPKLITLDEFIPFYF